MCILYISIKPPCETRRFQTVEKVCFSKKVLVLNPYKNALWALRPAKPLGVLSRHPCRNPKPLPRGEGLCMLGWLCVLQSLAAYTPGIRAGAILLGLPPLDQARMLAVSHTKPLHDAVAQMADDLYGGYAPATSFSISKRFIDRRKPPCETRRFIVYLIVFDYLITLTEITASPALILSATLSALPLTSRTV